MNPASVLWRDPKEWEFREVIATVLTENVASHRVMQKLGFQAMGSTPSGERS